MVRQFNEIYRRNPRYYGTAVPQNFNDFLMGRSLAALNCLDLGAGQGRYSLHLARGGARVRAVDYSTVAMTQLAKSAAEEKLAIATEVADLCAYELPTAEYDLIVGTTVLDHLDAPCLREMATSATGSLKPGGIIYCEVFTTADPGWNRQPEQPRSETAGPVRHYFATGELQRLFPELTILTYREYVKQDRTHGTPHWHGLALLIGVKV
ncbi:MAG: class I SAM-dependent methyltransferase [Desulfobulbaceae bacterium]|nr:class I SAM-dependent methyltransferase [Desulfobulbaceae bacterium]